MSVIAKATGLRGVGLSGVRLKNIGLSLGAIILLSTCSIKAPVKTGGENSHNNIGVASLANNAGGVDRGTPPTVTTAGIEESHFPQPTSAAAPTTGANITTDTPVKPGDLWERIRQGFALTAITATNLPAQKLVERYEQGLIRNQRLISQVGENAAPYLYFVVTELEKNHLPLELALLPIIESRYDPLAYSPRHASGLWQFIPATGKRFGLDQDWWYDQRRDVVAATGAAIQYLLYLHQRFDNDWLLAMAAYNAGQGNVIKAIRKNRARNQPTDYWSLDLPKETRHYIPKLLAWRNLILNAGEYDITLTPIPNQAYFAIADTGSPIDLAKAANLAEVDIAVIYRLNPAYNRGITDPSAPHDLLLPVSQVDTFANNLQDLPQDRRMAWRRYRVKRNDSLSQIARQFNTTTTAIARANGLTGHRIRAGTSLLIPTASRESALYSQGIRQRLPGGRQWTPGNHSQRVEHRVLPGESLWSIARQYGVTMQALAYWNQMLLGDVLSVGKKLVVWTATTAINHKQEPRKLYYTVKNGDSLAYIADKFQVQIRDIKSWNNKLSGRKAIQPGQLLTLFVALTDSQLMAN